MNIRLLLISIGVVALIAAPAMAKKADHVQKQKHSKVVKQEAQSNGSVPILFGSRDRDEIRFYLKRTYASSCPPGLAKKDNGCLPPGQAKKYVIGGMLPSENAPLPHALRALIGPAPLGTFYTMVDKDVLLVTEGAKKILDAVTLFSAVE